ncbi:MAG TPA: oxidoreductase, partial [Thermoanaerobaculia bacterium]|nr:oxidoreductase [Thermoanaerobaculia bacterium]
ISEKTAWTSGSLGTVLRTVDGGSTWQNVGPPGTATLQFRDIEAFDADHAVILSIGNGSDSRVYVTSDAGRHWTLGFVNDDPNAFYDCMTFFDRRHGLALSDPVDGRFRLIVTHDGGRTWRVLPAEMPAALPGEFAFAASGQCLVSDGGRRAWIASGGGAEARVFRSDNWGATWQVAATPIRSGPTAGIFALAFRDPRHGLAVGGDFLTPTSAPDAAALTDDGGASWSLVAQAPNEYRSGAAWVNGHEAVAVGPSGSDVSEDQGASWTRFDSGSFDTVDCSPNACWAAGEQGRVAYLVRTH